MPASSRRPNPLVSAFDQQRRHAPSGLRWPARCRCGRPPRCPCVSTPMRPFDQARAAGRRAGTAGAPPLPKITTSGANVEQGARSRRPRARRSCAARQGRTSPRQGTSTLCAKARAADPDAAGLVAGEHVGAGAGCRAGTSCGDNSSFAAARAPHALHEAHRQVQQAGQRLLRHPRPGARQGPADGGRGPQDHQAQHRQPGRVRARAARRDRAGHDPQPAVQRPATPTARACSRRASRWCTTRRKRASPASRSTTSTWATAPRS